MSDPFQLLLVDDERAFSALTQEYLEAKGHSVALYHNAIDAFTAFQAQPFDLCILDIKMPIKDGFALAEEIRNSQPEMPIIFLTGQTDKKDRIKGLTIGADDYITKPFSMEELCLRVQAIMRRVKTQEKQKQDAPPAAIGNYVFRIQTRELQFQNQVQKLSAIEAQLLHLFCESGTGMIERETALRQIWKDEEMLHGRSLNVYVSKLRQYLKKDPAIEILNVHGVGYQLVVKE
jgi:DNA-binding response OmpR family regulator